MKRFFGTALAAVVLMTGNAAEAGMLADLSIVNRTTGQSLPVHVHQGRYYVAGTPGDKYAVSVRNKLGQRVMAVVSVDGVNVVSGETAATSQTGYVLRSATQYEINGWRKSTDEVAAFVFTALSDSYAARTGRPGNVGVIGLAVFREYQLPHLQPEPMTEMRSRDDAAGNASSRYSAASEADAQKSAPAVDAARASAPVIAKRPREEKLGTGHGGREASPVTYTDFQRASQTPDEVITIQYDSYRNLLARGIIPPAPRPLPNPFPGGSFVPDPRG